MWVFFSLKVFIRFVAVFFIIKIIKQNIGKEDGRTKTKHETYLKHTKHILKRTPTIRVRRCKRVNKHEAEKAWIVISLPANRLLTRNEANKKRNAVFSIEFLLSSLCCFRESNETWQSFLSLRVINRIYIAVPFTE